MRTNFVQVLPGGICFVHGPYEGLSCPQSRAECIAKPHKPEYIALAAERKRKTNKVYTQSEFDELKAAEFTRGYELAREDAVKIADSFEIIHEEISSDDDLHKNELVREIVAAVRSLTPTNGEETK